jgi:transposase
VVQGMTLRVPPDIDEEDLTRMIRAIRTASQ